jgi:hypothetical protein
MNVSRAPISLPTDIASRGPEEVRESRVDAPPPPPSTEEVVERVKVADRGSWEAKRTLEFVKRNADPSDGMTPREVGACKTVVSGLITLGGAVGAIAVTPNKYAGAIVGFAVGKLVGDGVAAELCDPPGTK